MSDLLERYRKLCNSIDDRVVWACTLEATAPKFGNVHPTASFSNLCWNDFSRAASILARQIETGLTLQQNIGVIVLRTSAECRQVLDSNANLGIALLIAPLAVALAKNQRAKCGDLSSGMLDHSSSDNQTSSPNELRLAVREVLSALTPEDGRDVFHAIRLAAPGGLGSAKEMDVNDTSDDQSIDLRQAMVLAADYDLIARQYANDFQELFAGVVPILKHSINDVGDMLWGIREAQLRCLARWPDSLIARKCGIEKANEVQRKAQRILQLPQHERAVAEQEFDCWLRSEKNRLNPGTTADMIAAGLFVLLSL